MLHSISSFGGALLLVTVSFVLCYAFQLRYSLDSPSFVSCSSNPRFCRFRYPRHIRQKEQLSDNDSVAEAYHTAKFIRQVYGPEAAIPFYQTIVSHLNPTDYSAASRIAATGTLSSTTSSLLVSSSINRTTKSLQPQQKQDIQSFANILRSSNFTASNVNDIFDAPKTYTALCSATGPIYIKPITSTYPPIPCPFLFPSNTSKGERKDSIQCLIALFLLGFSLPRNILVSSLMGGNETVCLMERLGLIFSCTIDPTLMVPTVSIFPLDINTHSMNCTDTNYYNLPGTPQKTHNKFISLFFATDWHPNVLLSTTALVGTKEQLHEGTVMYIGPDSLALVAHWPTVLLTHLPSLLKQDQRLHHYTTNYSTTTTTITNTSFETNHTMDTSKYIQILDLCCGSGIQALSYLSILNYFLSTTNERRKPKATCVDINQRALRFTRFNAILNDLDESVETIEGNILDWERTKLNSTNEDHDEHYHANITWTEPEANYHHILKSAPYDIILANPPFIPVPPLPEALSITDISNSSSFPRLNKHNSDFYNDSSLLLINSISKRYGLFSSGGPTGEDILQSIIRIAPRLLSDSNDANSVVAIVSEFMNPDKTLRERINDSWSLPHQQQQQARHYRPNNTYTVNCSNVHFEENKEWGKTLPSSIHSTDYTDVGVAFTNQFPIPAELYASRRAADRGGLEEQRWKAHLEQMGIHAISPGLLFIYRVRATMDNHTLCLCNNTTDTEDVHAEKNRKSISSRNSSRLCSYQVILPKSSLGSIWTPHNYEAVMFTMKKIKEVLYANKK